MRGFRWAWGEHMQWVEEATKAKSYKTQVAQSLHPEASQNISQIMTDWPWLSTGVIASLGQMGVRSHDPLVTAVARLEFQRRTQQNDWAQFGDQIVPRVPPPKSDAITPEAEPVFPPVAPEPGSPAATDAMSNAVPEAKPEAAMEKDTAPTPGAPTPPVEPESPLAAPQPDTQVTGTPQQAPPPTGPPNG